MGYLISRDKLNQGRIDGNKSSIKALIHRNEQLSALELMTGEHSLGAYLEKEGFRAVPSPNQPSPGTDKYYRGGYITERHGSYVSGEVDAIQV